MHRRHLPVVQAGDAICLPGSAPKDAALTCEEEDILFSILHAIIGADAEIGNASLLRLCLCLILPFFDTRVLGCGMVCIGRSPFSGAHTALQERLNVLSSV